MFIALLCLAAFSIAGSAAYFSVYGLANTFHGVFWSVIISCGALEFGKLVATSYLYRYWKTTNVLLKIYMIIGVLVLMSLTSMGIFGYLSTGYQTDALPLKQIEQQSKLLEDERTRLISRKQQIDNQISNLPADYSKSRIKLMNAFKSEQDTVTSRITALDSQILELKTKQINTEAHVGPIIYIAKAFGVSPDDATKWLIYLIIFVFDPMAVALTLAVNTAIKQRENDKKTIDEYVENVIPEEDEEEEIVSQAPECESCQEDDSVEEVHTEIIEVPIIPKSDYVEYDGEPWVYEPSDNIIEWTGSIENTEEPDTFDLDEPLPDEPLSQEVIEEPEQIDPTVELPPVEPPARRVRPYGGLVSNASLDDLINQYQYFKTKIDRGELLSQDEIWSYQAIKEAIQHQGFSAYI